MSAKPPGLRKHPALTVLVLFITGIICGDVAPLHPFVCLVSSLLLLCIAFVLVAMHHRSASLVSLCALLPVAGATDIAVNRESGMIADTLGNRTIIVEGRVSGWPTNSGETIEFTMVARKAIVDSSLMHCDILVLARARRDSTLLSPGMMIVAKGRLDPPSRRRNPGAFDQRSFLSARGVSGIFTVDRGSQVLCLQEPSMMRRLISRTRSFVASVIRTRIGGAEGGFLAGLLLGDRSGIPRATRDSFAQAGVSHILAVSGTHVAIVAAFLFFVCEILRIPTVIRSCVIAAGLIVFMVMTGSQAPVARATIMGLILLLGNLLGERANAFNTIGVAGLVILGGQPYELFDPGFQLSFGAVIAIVHGYPRLNMHISRIHGSSYVHQGIRIMLRLGAASAAALIGTLPFTIVTFGRISLVGLVANIVVIPAAAIGIILGLMTILISPLSDFLAAAYGDLTTVVLRGILFCADAAGRQSFSMIDVSAMHPAEVATVCVAIVLVSQLNQPHRARILTILLLATANVAVCFRMPGQPVLQVSAMDVGQGDACVIRFPDGKVMVVDAGPLTGAVDSGERIVGPFLRRHGITTIDVLVATHPHADHIGGMPWLLDHFDVRMVLDCGVPTASALYERYEGLARQCSVMTAHSGMIIREFSNARVYVLHPDSLWTTPQTTLNNHSVVLKILYGNTSILLAGDAEHEAEERMGIVYGTFLHSSILKVGHHGSATSSSPGFLENVHPGVALVSVGRFNSFHHPSQAVLERLRTFGAEVHRTDLEGALIFASDAVRWTMVDWH